jgi:hypothetical protein
MNVAPSVGRVPAEREMTCCAANDPATASTGTMLGVGRIYFIASRGNSALAAANAHQTTGPPRQLGGNMEGKEVLIFSLRCSLVRLAD